MKPLIRLERQDSITTLWLNRPERMNAMNLAMWAELGAALKIAAEDRALRCLLLRGAANEEGKVAFGAGADIAEFTLLRRNAEEAVRYAEVMEQTSALLRDFPRPTVAQLEGASMGGGLELALHCDLRLAATTARFGIPINRIGHGLPTPAFAALLELCGRAVAMELLLEGRIYDATEALSKGLVTRLVADDKLAEETAATCQRIAQGAPLAAAYHRRFAKRLLEPTPLNDTERRAPYDLCDSADYQEGIRAFLAKEKPRFSDR